MKSHITRLVCTCFGVLRRIRSIRRSLPRESMLTLISSLVMSKLDYCNVAFAGLPRGELDRLQSVINAAARLTVRHSFTTTSCRCSPTCTGCGSLNASSTNFVYWSSIACMGPRRVIYKRSSVRSRTSSHDVACALPPRQA